MLELRPASALPSHLAGAAVAILSLIGCTSVDLVGPVAPGVAGELPGPGHVDARRLAVSRFENRTLYPVTDGMHAMLTSALVRSGRAVVVEREYLDDALSEQRLGSLGILNPATAPPTGAVAGAELLVVGVLTEFQPASSGLRGLVGLTRSTVAIDLRLVDAESSRVLAAASVRGVSTGVSLDTTGLAYASGVPLGALEAWGGSATEAAIRACIEEAVAFIVENGL